MRRAAIVFNPTSSRLPRLRTLVAKHELLDGWQPTVWIPTTDAGPVDHLIAGIPRDVTLVIAAGGDGTVRAVGAALSGGKLPFGIIPVGTANLLARNLGIPLRRLSAAVEIAFSGGRQALDHAVIDYELEDGSEHSRPYFVMAGFGIDADMVTGTSPANKDRYGWAAYVMPILRSLWRAPVDTATYSLDGGVPVIATVHSFIVGNGGTITAGLRLLPEARLDDGKLDVLAMRSITGSDRSAIVRWLRPFNLRLLKRELPDATAAAANTAGGAFHYAAASEITIALETPTVMQSDGDLLGRVVSARFSIVPSALRVNAPRARQPYRARNPRTA